MPRRFMSRAIAAALLALAGGNLPAQVTFRGFGTNDVYITDMSADGTVVVGMFVAGPKANTAFRWTAAGGLEEIGGNMDTVRISRDAKTIVGSTLDSQGIRNAAIWMGGKNWRVLGGVPGGVPGEISAGGSLSQALGVSADGSVIVGSANVASQLVHAFRWDALNGMVDLGTMVRNESSYATGVSANGKAIVGWTGNPGVAVHVGDTRSGVVFVDGIARLLHSYGWAGTAYATNDVGSTIVGRYHPSDASSTTETSTTWRWSAWDGKLEDLGAVPLKPGVNRSEYTSQPYGLSDTGDVVVGVSGAFQRSAAMWTPATAMVSVADFLTANGVTSHRGWDLRLANYVSPNGKTIAGTGFNPQAIAESWIVTLP
jgi:probable HAF family extracellular repeat protein